MRTFLISEEQLYKVYEYVSLSALETGGKMTGGYRGKDFQQILEVMLDVEAIKEVEDGQG